MVTGRPNDHERKSRIMPLLQKVGLDLAAHVAKSICRLLENQLSKVPSALRPVVIEQIEAALEKAKVSHG